MRVKKQVLKSRKQTAAEIKMLIEKYADDLKLWAKAKNYDMVPLSALSMEEFFSLVRTIPYQRDEYKIEVVGRPNCILKRRKADCKKKAILICSWAKLNNVQYRLVGSSSKKNGNIHHIFPQLYIKGKWYNVDATYNYYQLFQPKEVTNYELF